MRSRMEGLLPLQVLRHLVFRLQHQAFHAFALDDVLLQDLFRVLDGAVGVPDLLGIDHHGGAELAAVEAQRLVDAHAIEAELLGAPLHVVAQPLRALLLAAAARMALRPLVHAAEHVRLVIGRGIARLLAVGHDRELLLRSRCAGRIFCAEPASTSAENAPAISSFGQPPRRTAARTPSASAPGWRCRPAARSSSGSRDPSSASPPSCGPASPSSPLPASAAGPATRRTSAPPPACSRCRYGPSWADLQVTALPHCRRDPNQTARK